MPRPPAFHHYRLPVSLARAIADDLRASGLFEEVQFEGDDSPPATTYELRGILWDPRLTGTFTTFGLSFFALPLMLLPLSGGTGGRCGSARFTAHRKFPRENTLELFSERNNCA